MLQSTYSSSTIGDQIEYPFGPWLVHTTHHMNTPAPQSNNGMKSIETYSRWLEPFSNTRRLAATIRSTITSMQRHIGPWGYVPMLTNIAQEKSAGSTTKNINFRILFSGFSVFRCGWFCQKFFSCSPYYRFLKNISRLYIRFRRTATVTIFFSHSNILRQR